MGTHAHRPTTERSQSKVAGTMMLSERYCIPAKMNEYDFCSFCSLSRSSAIVYDLPTGRKVDQDQIG